MNIRRRHLLILILAGFLALFLGSLSSAQNLKQEIAKQKRTHHGMLLMTVEPGDITNFDVNVMAEAPALKKLRKVLDLIYNMSELGHGVAKNVMETEKWYARTAKNGNQAAKERLKRLWN